MSKDLNSFEQIGTVGLRSIPSSIDSKDGNLTFCKQRIIDRVSLCRVKHIIKHKNAIVPSQRSQNGIINLLKISRHINENVGPELKTFELKF